jgi:uncharacterized protein YuzE
MRVTYDGEVDAAYIRLKDMVTPGEVKSTFPCHAEGKGLAPGVMINLDFDWEGRLTGIEVLSASRGLPKELLDHAEIIG